MRSPWSSITKWSALLIFPVESKSRITATSAPSTSMVARSMCSPKREEALTVGTEAVVSSVSLTRESPQGLLGSR